MHLRVTGALKQTVLASSSRQHIHSKISNPGFKCILCFSPAAVAVAAALPIMVLSHISQYLQVMSGKRREVDVEPLSQTLVRPVD